MIEINFLSTLGSTVRMKATVALEAQGKPISIWWSRASGELLPVRGWSEVLAPATIVLIDHEAPLNEALTLVIESSVGGRVSRQVTVESLYPLVTDPIRGIHIPVVIGEWESWAHERAGQVLEISGAKFPLVVEGRERAATSSARLLHTVAAGSERQLAELLDRQSVVMLRPSCPDMPAAWVSVRDRTRSRVSRRRDSAWVDELQLVHVAQPNAGEPAFGATLGDLHALVPGTLADIAARWPGTLADIALDGMQGS